jgi:hypothetical protein
MNFRKPGLEPEHSLSDGNILFSLSRERASRCARAIFTLRTVQVLIHTSGSFLWKGSTNSTEAQSTLTVKFHGLLFWQIVAGRNVKFQEVECCG